MVCEECGKQIPDEFLQPMYVSTIDAEVLVDPECALKIINRVNGTNRTEFVGSMAQQLLEDYREWKEKNAAST